MYDFVLIYHNCWNDFRPILATTVRIAGTISYQLSLVQTYTQRFRIIIAGTISYPSIVTEFAPFASYMLVRLRTNYGGYSHLPAGWYDFVPIITGVFYRWCILLAGTISYQLSLTLGSRGFIVMFLQVTLFWTIQQPFTFLWSTNPVIQQPFFILRSTSSPVIHLS